MDSVFVATDVVAPATGKFVLFGALHLTILLLTVVTPAVMSLLTRRSERPEIARVLAVILAASLVLDYAFTITWALHVGKIIYWENALPMQLCDWATVVSVVALVWRRQWAYELAYFWGLSGTFQAVLTPDTKEAFPNPLFITFFVSHCGIIIAVLFLTWGLKLRPRPGSVWQAWLWSQLYLASAGLVNWLFRADKVNFGYLAAKPSHGSLLDLFGPWPWYIVTLEIMALVFFAVFYLPFWIADRQRAARSRESV